MCAVLRDEFRINPRDQDMGALMRIFAWSGILRPSILGQMFEKEFFPKWLDVLYTWLVQPNVNFEEVAEWYDRHQSWKDAISVDVRMLPAIEQGFTRGLQLINEALDFGKDAPTKLPKPTHADHPPETAPSARQPKSSTSWVKKVTFREIVEEFVASHNLLFMPAGKVDAKSRLPLYRISRSVDGRGGVLVYLLDDAAWVPKEGANARAMRLEELVLKATKS